MDASITIADALKSLNLPGLRTDSGPENGDVAEMNLACAWGLPGSERIDLRAMLNRLDEMATHVEREISRNYYRFLRNAGEFQNSQAQYCVLMLITVLQQDFGVRYNPQRIRDPNFLSSGDLFIHGMLGGEGGTCASMPVLYAAIGRRLGWPIRLVHARAHIFCRWDDPEGHHDFGKEFFNIEGSSSGGHIFSDEYYRTWPERISESDVERGVYLKSLTPEEELASFLATRGHCLFDNGRIGQARDAYRLCRLLAPMDPHYGAFSRQADCELDRILEERTLRDYYGPDIPLPIGLFPRRVLRKMAADMALSEVQRFEATRRLSEIHRKVLRDKAFASLRNGPGIPRLRSRPMPPAPPTLGGGSPHPSMFNASDERLPARLLQEDNPHALMHRRQEAMSLVQLMPARPVLAPSPRISLLPTSTDGGFRTLERN